MGRPRQHDERTAGALLAAAERIVERDGLEALTVRRVADDVGATTRAVYSVFGSKDALVGALGRQAYDLLRSQVLALPETPDPADDLVEAGVSVFRRFATEHPALFRIGIQRTRLDPALARTFADAAGEALAGLDRRVERLDAAGALGGRRVRDVSRVFHALCEGLAAMELRGLLPAGDEERVWRDALTALVQGLRAPPPARD